MKHQYSKKRKRKPKEEPVINEDPVLQKMVRVASQGIFIEDLRSEKCS